MNIIPYLKYKLCYIDEVDDWNTFKLYFTDNFDSQWGDDWDDRPANCNAEPPYEDEDHHIFEMYIELCSCGHIFGGKSYSVEDLNTRKAPWLLCDSSKNSFILEGGDSLQKVLDKFKSTDTRMFVEYKGEDK